MRRTSGGSIDGSRRPPPRAHRDPPEENGQNGKDDGADVRPTATRSRVLQKTHDDEQARGVEDEEGTHQRRDDCQSSKHWTLPVNDRQAAPSASPFESPERRRSW